MLELPRIIKPPVADETTVIVRNLIYLRFLVLVAVSLLTLLAGSYYDVVSSTAGVAAILVAVAAWSSLVLARRQLTRSPGAAIREVVVDFAWVLLLVLLVGRSSNPFIYYYLVLVAISASIFSARTAWAFCVGGILAYSGLLLLDIGAHFEHMAELYRAHLAAMWLNYLGSSLVTCYFVSRLARLIREQQAQLATAREETLKNEQLIGIGTVAASTVHSLATPLATLTVLAEDMSSGDCVQAELQDDLAMMLSQIHRCKLIMNDLSNLAQGWSNESNITVAGLKTLLEEHFALNSPGNIPSFTLEKGVGTSQIISNLLLQHALINLINNALESEAAPAEVIFSRQEGILNIVIENKTSMQTDEVFARWGKPTLSDKQAGLGIGSFLANSTIEKLGGSVRLDAEEGALTKIVVTVALPLLEVRR